MAHSVQLCCLTRNWITGYLVSQNSRESIHKILIYPAHKLPERTWCHFQCTDVTQMFLLLCNSGAAVAQRGGCWFESRLVSAISVSLCVWMGESDKCCQVFWAVSRLETHYMWVSITDGLVGSLQNYYRRYWTFFLVYMFQAPGLVEATDNSSRKHETWRFTESCRRIL